MENYRVVKKIGKGSYGNVYLVEAVAGGETLVLKKIPLLNMDEKQRASSRQEVQLMELLRHPYLCRFRDSFLHKDEKLCIVMSYYPGGDLAQYITARKTPLKEDEILMVLTQILLGLQFMHARRVLHRDVKTMNIFLQPNQTSLGFSAVLGDLGIARVLDSSTDLAHTAIGTPLYMSPEVCNGEKYNYPADVWSVGCVAYELAFFKHPFQSSDLNGLIMKIINGAYTAPPKGKYSRSVIDLLAKMLAKAPSKRPLTDSLLQMPILRKFALQCNTQHLTTDGYEAVLVEQLQSLGLLGVETEACKNLSGGLSGELDTLKEKAGRKRRTEKMLKALKDDAEHERLLIDDRINVLVKQQQAQAQQLVVKREKERQPMLSAKERVLRQKQHREEEEEKAKLVALEAARKEGYNMRQGAKKAEFEQYHGQDKTSKEGDLDTQIAELEDEVASYRKQIGQIVGRIHQHIVEEGSTDAELLSPSGVFTSEGMWVCEEEEEEICVGVKSRWEQLRESLISSLSGPVFETAYTMLKSRDVSLDNGRCPPQLLSIIPEQHHHLWEDLDQLAFMETSMDE